MGSVIIRLSMADRRIMEYDGSHENGFYAMQNAEYITLLSAYRSEQRFPGSLDRAGNPLDQKRLIVSGVFRGHAIEVPVVFVFQPRVEVVLMRKAVPEAIKRVQAGFPINGNTKIDKAGARVVRDENIIFALQVAVGHATLVYCLDYRVHLREKSVAVTDCGLSHGLSINMFEYEVAVEEESITARDTADSFQVAIDVVLASQHRAVEPGQDALAGGCFHKNLVATCVARVNTALVAAALEALAFSQAGKNVGIRDTGFVHNLV